MRNPTLAGDEKNRREADPVLRNIVVAILLGLILAGAAARMQDLGYPQQLMWDEHHFVENARNLLHGRSDWNDHPPLGKLLIASGMLLAGDDSTGWRIAPLVLGLVLIVLAYLLGASVFQSRGAGLLAAAFIAVDGFTMAYSQIALLDGMLATTMVAAALFAWRARSWVAVCLGGVFVGLAMSIKFSGGVMLLPLLLIILLRFGLGPKTYGLMLLGSFAAVVTYVAEFVVGLTLAGDPNGLADVAQKTVELFRHHLALDDWKHPQTARWYTWFVPSKRLVLLYERDGSIVRALTADGHPILWWGVHIALIGTVVYAVRRRRRKSAALRDETSPPPRGAYYLWMLWFLPLLPWIFSNRDSYLYHYLPSYVFGLVLLAGLVSKLGRRRPLLLGFVIAVAAVFMFCVPVWSKIPFSADSLVHALFFSERG